MTSDEREKGWRMRSQKVITHVRADINYDAAKIKGNRASQWTEKLIEKELESLKIQYRIYPPLSSAESDTTNVILHDITDVILVTTA